jgi:hypothetical protein
VDFESPVLVDPSISNNNPEIYNNNNNNNNNEIEEPLQII